MSRKIRNIGIVLDIDGVLLRGKEVIPSAIEALQLIQEYAIPHVFMTNGGGCTESEKAKSLQNKFGINVDERNIILAHTPFKKLVDKYRTRNIMILGNDKCIHVAREYGFQKIVTTKDIVSYKPLISPWKYNYGLKDAQVALMRDPIEAAFIMHDPIDWSLDMQVLSDILIDNHLINAIDNSNRKQLIPLYASNADLVYTNEYHLPRYTQGSFIYAFKEIFRKFTHNEIQVEFYGKPFKVQYELAEEILNSQVKDEDIRIDKFYGIGDNPLSDIHGANNAGENWRSILVRTGVFRSNQPNDTTHKANLVVHDVHEAIKNIIDNYSP